MSRYRLVWLELAEQQYLSLPAEARDLVDQRLARIIDDPTGDTDAVYNQWSDQWSVLLGERGFLFYAVVGTPATVIILRLVYGNM